MITPQPSLTAQPRRLPRKDLTWTNGGMTSDRRAVRLRMEYVGRELRLIPVLGQSRRGRGAGKTRSTGAISA